MPLFPLFKDRKESVGEKFCVIDESYARSVALWLDMYRSNVCTGVFVGGVGGYTLDGTFGGNGAIFAYTGTNATNLTSTSPVKNGGMSGATGNGYGAGGGYASNTAGKSATLGRSGVIVIQRVE